MTVSLKGTGLEITQSIRRYLDEKIIKLVEKLIKKGDEFVKLDLEVGRQTFHHRHGKIFRAEANLSVGSRVLYADAVGEDIYEAIDLLEEELEREIKKFKNKKITLERKGARVLKNKR